MRKVFEINFDLTDAAGMDSEEHPCENGSPEGVFKRCDTLLNGELGYRSYEAPHDSGSKYEYATFDVHDKSSEMLNCI